MLGDAGISSRHTLALVNRGGATAAEILALAEEITETVKERFGIRLGDGAGDGGILSARENPCLKAQHTH